MFGNITSWPKWSWCDYDKSKLLHACSDLEKQKGIQWSKKSWLIRKKVVFETKQVLQQADDENETTFEMSTMRVGVKMFPWVQNGYTSFETI